MTLIDSRPFVKTVRRQRAVVVNGRLRWKKAPSQPGEPSDQLLRDNIDTVEGSVTQSHPRAQCDNCLSTRARAA